MSQAAQILGSVDFLGNPMGLLNDVTEGVSELIKYGNVGGLIRNVTHGVSNSAAKVRLSSAVYNTLLFCVRLLVVVFVKCILQDFFFSHRYITKNFCLAVALLYYCPVLLISVTYTLTYTCNKARSNCMFTV